jgi:hypothetical protein
MHVIQINFDIGLYPKKEFYCISTDSLRTSDIENTLYLVC